MFSTEWNWIHLEPCSSLNFNEAESSTISRVSCSFPASNCNSLALYVEEKALWRCSNSLFLHRSTNEPYALSQNDNIYCVKNREEANWFHFLECLVSWKHNTEAAVMIRAQSCSSSTLPHFYYFSLKRKIEKEPESAASEIQANGA